MKRWKYISKIHPYISFIIMFTRFVLIFLIFIFNTEKLAGLHSALSAFGILAATDAHPTLHPALLLQPPGARLM